MALASAHPAFEAAEHPARPTAHRRRRHFLPGRLIGRRPVVDDIGDGNCLEGLRTGVSHHAGMPGGRVRRPVGTRSEVKQVRPKCLLNGVPGIM